MASKNALQKALFGFSKEALISLLVELAEKNKSNLEYIKQAAEKDQESPLLETYRRKISSFIRDWKKPQPKAFSELRKIIKEFLETSKDKLLTLQLMFFCMKESISFIKNQKQCSDDFFHALADMFYHTLEYSQNNALLIRYRKHYEKMLALAKKTDTDLYEELTTLYHDYIDA
ncbi:MAG: hypothetical protein JW904_13090 [Spirochaetales bacterium]|nr:hypothetical protein [Spirochaetales bacterium]